MNVTPAQHKAFNALLRELHLRLGRDFFEDNADAEMTLRVLDGEPTVQLLGIGYMLDFAGRVVAVRTDDAGVRFGFLGERGDIERWIVAPPEAVCCN
jgi:hypothetical protein